MSHSLSESSHRRPVSLNRQDSMGGTSQQSGWLKSISVLNPEDNDTAYVETLLAEQARHPPLLPEDHWSIGRKLCAAIIKHQSFEVVLLIIIVLNMICTVLETDSRAAGDSSSTLRWVNRLFLALYIVELFMRVYVLRHGFWLSWMNVLDVTIVMVDIVAEILSGAIGNVPAASMLRLIRVARFLRAGHIIVFFPELYWMTRGMFCAMKALFWGVLLIIVVLLMWSIVAVEVLNPIMSDVARTGVWDDCRNCELAFDSVSDSLLTLFSQICAGDSWGTVSLPLIRMYPWRACPILFGALFSINLGILNLILAVIVDRAQQAHQEDLRHILKVKAAEYKVSRQKLYNIVQSMDTDNSGQVSVSELLVGYDEHPEFRTVLQAMDISKEDMGTVFSIMDKDKSGTVDYSEFAMQLHKMKTSDSHTLLVFIQAYVKELREKVASQIGMLQEALHERWERSHKELVAKIRNATRDSLDDLSMNGNVSRDKSNGSAYLDSAPQFNSEGAIDGAADATVLNQLRQAVSELTEVMRDASKKNLEMRPSNASLEIREPKSVASGTPITPSGSLSCAPWATTQSSQAKELQGTKLPMHRCCQIRVSEDGLISRCV